MRACLLELSCRCAGCVEHVVNLTLRDIKLQAGGPWLCTDVDSVRVQGVTPWPKGSTCTASDARATDSDWLE